MSIIPVAYPSMGLLLLTSFLLFSYAECQILALYPKHPLVKRISTGAMFTCMIRDYVHGGPEQDIFWRAPHGEIITDTKGRVHVERISAESHRLYITSVQISDAGLYSCESIINGALITVDTRLEIFEEIEFRDAPGSVQHKTGDNPFLECSATGHPQPELSWRFNRKSIYIDNKKYKKDPMGLLITNITREDAGFYECRAEVTSQGTLKVKVITVDIQYKPFMSYRPPEVTEFIMGERSELRCQGLGNPEVSYQWFRAQESGTHAPLKVMLGDSDTYVMESVKREDEGRYFCKVTNDLGSEEIYTDVVVVEIPEVEDLAEENPLEYNVLFINCVVTGHPKPKVTWQRVGSDTPYVEGTQLNDSSITVDSSRAGVTQLVIREVQRSHSGQYMCSAENRAGRDSSIANVTVEYVPTINTTDTSKHGWPGQVRNFTCMGDGLPLPTINWLREGQYISNSSTYQVVTRTNEIVISTLQITIHPDQPWVFGSYSCIAKNRYNYVRTEVNLHEATMPDLPRNVTVEEETPTSVLLKADLPGNNGGLPVTSWRIEYVPMKVDNVDQFENHDLYEDGPKVAIFQEGDKLEVVDLASDVEYTFYVSVGNLVGYSGPVKFKVRTPKQHKVQADLPGNPDDPDAGILRTGSDGKEALNYNNKMKEVQSDSAMPNITSIAIAVGATVVGIIVVIIVGVVICTRKRAREKADDYSTTWKSMFGNGKKVPMGEDGAVVKVSESKDIDQVQLEIRRVDGSQPDLIAQASPKPSHIDKCRSPMEIRKQNVYSGSPKKCPADQTASTPNTIQQRAWEHMLIVKEMEPEDQIAEVQGIEKNDELTPMMDLPPPPQFLLDNNDASGHVATDNVSYHDVLDGYHSEENIDDGDHFEIRVPHQNHQNHHHPAT